MLPAYLGLIAGSAGGVADRRASARRSLWWNGLAFVLGLSLVFALLDASAILVGILLLQQRLLLMQIGGVLIVILGLQMLGVLRLDWLARTYLRVDPAVLPRGGGPASAFLVGTFFGIGWTPCVGLFLGSLLTQAAVEDTVAEGTLLLFLYGLGVPFVVAGLGAVRALAWSRGLRPHLAAIERAGGIVLVAMGVLLFTGELTVINVWAIRTFGLGWAF